MLVVDSSNARTVKDLRFMLWAFLDATIDLPMEDSIDLFGHHTTYRYCKNIDVDKLADTTVTYEHRKLLTDNPHVSNRELYKKMGEKALYPVENQWLLLLARYDGLLADAIAENASKLKLSTAGPDLMHKVLTVVATESPERLLPVIKQIFTLPSYMDSITMCISEISHRYPGNYLDALVLLKEHVVELIRSNYIEKPRITSLVLANGGLDVWPEVHNLEHLPDWMGANDALNIGVSMGEELTNWERWRHQSKYNPITRRVSKDVIDGVFKSVNPDRFMYLGNFDTINQIDIISTLLDDMTVDAESVNHLCYCFLSLMQTDVYIPESVAETISAWAIDTGEERHVWKLFLADHFPPQLKENLKLFLEDR